MIKTKKIERRRFRNKFSVLPCILLRKTNNHIYLQLRMSGKIVTEYNTLNMTKDNLSNKADKIRADKTYIINYYKINRYYTDIFEKNYSGYIKKILD